MSGSTCPLDWLCSYRFFMRYSHWDVCICQWGERNSQLFYRSIYNRQGCFVVNSQSRKKYLFEKVSQCFIVVHLKTQSYA